MNLENSKTSLDKNRDSKSLKFIMDACKSNAEGKKFPIKLCDRISKTLNRLEEVNNEMCDEEPFEQFIKSRASEFSKRALNKVRYLHHSANHH